MAQNNQLINGNFGGKTLLSIEQLSRTDIELVLKLAARFEQLHNQRKLPQLLTGRVVKAIMFEDSSRTADTYLSAAAYLGATPIQPNLATSSKNKGEADVETVKVYSNNADAFIVRHGSASFMAALTERIKTPFVSGGHPGEHLLQTLKDLYTWQQLYGAIDGSRVVLVGYAAKYRTAASLVKGLSRFRDITLTVAAPAFGRLPAEVVELARASGISVTETEDVRPLLKQPGRFYIIRPPLEYCRPLERQVIRQAYKQFGYNISIESMQQAHPQADIFHPLPRTQEISEDFWHDPRAKYDLQEKNGLFVDMAVLALQLASARVKTLKLAV
jgi:aspartate carbamoyltransferase catalytic subunit